MRAHGRYGNRILATGAGRCAIVFLDAIGHAALIADDSPAINKMCQEQAPTQRRGDNNGPQRPAERPAFSYSDPAWADRRIGHSEAKVIQSVCLAGKQTFILVNPRFYQT